jgi:RNA polymerase sigma factor (sigma-70 family)
MPGQKDPSLPERKQSQFRGFYEAQYSGVYAFALRRVYGSKEDASDITAEIFMTAWRRLDDMPAPPADRLWVFGVARRVVYRHMRSSTRRSRLAERLGSEAIVARNKPDGAEAAVSDRLRVQAAITRLGRSDRDVLSLVFWEHLTHEEAAKVLGCSSNAVALRLLKAKARLGSILQADQDEADDERGREKGNADQEGRA